MPRPKNSTDKVKRTRGWTAEQIGQLQSLYPITVIQDLIPIIGKSERQLRKKARELGIPRKKTLNKKE